MGFNKLVVIKRMRGTTADDPESVAMFLDEARLAARLNHANIVHRYEVGEHEGTYFIAMEYIEGQPLSSIVARVADFDGKTPHDFALAWLRSKGLAY
jgi:serine/threonine-protein kinase